MPPSKEFVELIEKIKDGKRYQELLKEILDLHIRKNAGYSGDSGDPWFNFRQSLLFNITPFKGCLVRMTDKFSRISSLVKNPDNDKVGEAITDTLMDMAVYSLIAICLYEEENQKKEEYERIVCTEKTNIENSDAHFETEILSR